MKFLLSTLCGWFLFLSTSISYADTNTNTLEPITVTASRLSDMPPLIPTDVVTAEEIEKSGNNDLPNLLRFRLGIPTQTTGGDGQSTSVLLRGTESRHTLFLIDGVQIGSATTGLTAIEHLPTALFDNVQVTRGNVSAIYGAGALGGVVDMSLRTGDTTPSVSTLLRYGNHHQYQANVNYGGRVEDTRFFIGLNTQGTHGQTAMISGTAGVPNPDDDGYHNQSVFTSLSQQLDNGAEIGVHAFRIHANTRYDNPYANIEDDQLSKTDNNGLIAFWKMSFTTNWSSHFAFAHTEDNLKDYENGHHTSTFKTINRQLFWRNTFNVSEQQQLTGGADWLEQRVSATTGYDREKREVSSIYGGYSGLFGRHHLLGNLRFDHYSDFGDAKTYLAGYGYQLTKEWQVTANVGNAFAAPTFNHLFYPDFGNPDLKAEKSHNQEVSLRYRENQTAFRASVYYTTISNLIGGYPIRNYGKSEITGLELDWSYGFSPFLLTLKGNFQNPKDKETGETLNRRTKQYGVARLDYEKGPWEGGIEWFASGKKIDNGVHIGGYTLFNANINYRFNEEWRLGAYANNLFDRRYTELDGYEAPHLNVWLQLVYQPK